MSVMLEKALEAAQKQINLQHRLLDELLYYYESKPIGRLIERMLQWQADVSKAHWLNNMFGEVIDCQSVHFMGEVNDFVRRALMLGSYGSFRIEYRKPMKLGRDVQWAANGRYKTVEANQSDSEAKPYVFWGHEDNDCRDASKLLEAMDAWEATHSKTIDAK
jgi:hypothetical protein